MGLIETLHTCASEVAASGRGRIGGGGKRVGVGATARTKVGTLAGDGLSVAEVTSGVGGVIDSGVFVLVARPGELVVSIVKNGRVEQWRQLTSCS